MGAARALPLQQTNTTKSYSRPKPYTARATGFTAAGERRSVSKIQRTDLGEQFWWCCQSPVSSRSIQRVSFLNKEYQRIPACPGFAQFRSIQQAGFKRSTHYQLMPVIRNLSGVNFYNYFTVVGIIHYGKH